MREEYAITAGAAVCCFVAIAFQVLVKCGEVSESLGLAASIGCTFCCICLFWALMPVHTSLSLLAKVKRLLNRLSARRA